jgi:hypothetical protein
MLAIAMVLACIRMAISKCEKIKEKRVGIDAEMGNK